MPLYKRNARWRVLLWAPKLHMGALSHLESVALWSSWKLHQDMRLLQRVKLCLHACCWFSPRRIEMASVCKRWSRVISNSSLFWRKTCLSLSEINTSLKLTQPRRK